MFWPKSTRRAALLSYGLNVAYFLRLWLFLVLSSFLSTPRQMDFSREEAFYFRDGFCFQSLDFSTVSARFFGRNLPVAQPFFFPAFAWLIFRYVRYYLAYFLFIWLFSVFCCLLVPLKIRSIRNSQGDVAPPPIKRPPGRGFRGQKRGRRIARKFAKIWQPRAA